MAVVEVLFCLGIISITILGLWLGKCPAQIVNFTIIVPLSVYDSGESKAGGRV